MKQRNLASPTKAIIKKFQLINKTLDQKKKINSPLINQDNQQLENQLPQFQLFHNKRKLSSISVLQQNNKINQKIINVSFNRSKSPTQKNNDNLHICKTPTHRNESLSKSSYSVTKFYQQKQQNSIKKQIQNIKINKLKQDYLKQAEAAAHKRQRQFQERFQNIKNKIKITSKAPIPSMKKIISYYANYKHDE